MKRVGRYYLFKSIMILTFAPLLAQEHYIGQIYRNWNKMSEYISLNFVQEAISHVFHDFSSYPVFGGKWDKNPFLGRLVMRESTFGFTISKSL